MIRVGFLVFLLLVAITNIVSGFSVQGAVSVYYCNVSEPEAGVQYFEIWQDTHGNVLRFYLGVHTAIVEGEDSWFGWIPNKTWYGFKQSKAGVVSDKLVLVNTSVRPVVVTYGFDTRCAGKGDALQVVVHKYVYDGKRWHKWCDVFGCYNEIIEGDGWVEVYACRHGFQYVIYASGVWVDKVIKCGWWVSNTGSFGYRDKAGEFLFC